MITGRDLVVHLMIAAALVAVILLQKSEGGALGMGGGGMSGFMTGRSTANLLTRTTAVLAAGFFATWIALADARRTSARRARWSISPASAPGRRAGAGRAGRPAAPAAPPAK